MYSESLASSTIPCSQKLVGQLSALSPESVSHALVQAMACIAAFLPLALTRHSFFSTLSSSSFVNSRIFSSSRIRSWRVSSRCASVIKKDQFPMDWTPLILCLQFAGLVSADRDILDFALSLSHASFSALVLRSFLSSSPHSTRPLVVNRDHRSGQIRIKVVLRILDIEDFHAILKLQHHVLIYPVAVSVLSILKFSKERRHCKWFLVFRFSCIHCCLCVTILNPLSTSVHFW